MLRRYGTQMAILVSIPLMTFASCTRQPDREVVEERTDAQLETTEQQTDTSLTTAVQARLYGDDTLRGQHVEVGVDDGVATLSGTVASDRIEQQALSAARGVDGIVRVEDQLTVTEGDRALGRLVEGVPTTGSDVQSPGWITTKIHAQYFVDRDVKPWNIDVTTSAGGIVELRGEVDSAEAKAKAVQIARSTAGVTRVDDHLRVRSTDAQDGTQDRTDQSARGITDSDPWLTAKVQSKYFLDTEVKACDIDVTAQNGVVTLRGAVESERERR